MKIIRKAVCLNHFNFFKKFTENLFFEKHVDFYNCEQWLRNIIKTFNYYIFFSIKNFKIFPSFSLL